MGLLPLVPTDRSTSRAVLMKTILYNACLPDVETPPPAVIVVQRFRVDELVYVWVPLFLVSGGPGSR